MDSRYIKVGCGGAYRPLPPAYDQAEQDLIDAGVFVKLERVLLNYMGDSNKIFENGKSYIGFKYPTPWENYAVVPDGSQHSKDALALIGDIGDWILNTKYKSNYYNPCGEITLPDIGTTNLSNVGDTTELKGITNPCLDMPPPRELPMDHVSDAISYMKPTNNPATWDDYIVHGHNENIFRTNKKETKMNIEQVTLIDGKDSRNFSVDELLNLIVNIEVKMDKVNSLGSTSEGLNILVEGYEEEVESILALIDKTMGVDASENDDGY